VCEDVVFESLNFEGQFICSVKGESPHGIDDAVPYRFVRAGVVFESLNF